MQIEFLKLRRPYRLILPFCEQWKCILKWPGFLAVPKKAFASVSKWIIRHWTQWRFYVGVGGAIASPVFGFLRPVWHDAIINVTINNISLLHYVSIAITETPKFHCTRTDDVWWNFHVWKFHKLMADLIGMGYLDHKNFGVLHPQFWSARTATDQIKY